MAEGAGITFEFGETEASGAFWDRNPEAFRALMRLFELTNKVFGRPYQIRSRLEDICFHLGETCRTDFLEILFLAVNGYGKGAQETPARSLRASARSRVHPTRTGEGRAIRPFRGDSGVQGLQGCCRRGGS